MRLPAPTESRHRHLTGWRWHYDGARCETPPVAVSILLVEDDPRLQALGRKVLERQGYQVTLAGDGEQAVEATAANSFDLVLMDLSMPKMDGHQATRLIKARTPGLPIVAVTAHAMAADRERCVESGFDTFLAKPYQIPDLLAVVQSFAPKPV